MKTESRPNRPRSFVRPFVALLAAAAVPALAACRPAEGEELDRTVQGPVVESIPVETLRLSPRPFRSEFLATGTIEPQDDVVVSAEIAGRIVRLDLEVGDEVEAGAVVALLDDAAMTARLQGIDAQEARVKTLLDNAERELARESELFESKVGVERALDSARSLVETHRAELKAIAADREAARVDLAKFSIEAPVGGTVAEKLAEQGEYAAPGQPLLRIVNTENVEFVFAVAERDVPRISVGDPVPVAIDALGGDEFQGEVARISPSGNLQTRTFQVWARIANPHPHPILPGMSGKARIVRDAFDAVFALPEEAVLREGGEAFVYLVAGDVVRRSDPLTLVASEGARAFATAGVSDGQQAIVLGQYAVKPGTLVHVRRTHDEIPVRVFD